MRRPQPHLAMDGDVDFVPSLQLFRRIIVRKPSNETSEQEQSSQMKAVYDLGHFAGYHGESEDSNPYHIIDENDRYWTWLQGHCDGELDAEEEGFK